MLSKQGESVLVDVRTEEEWKFVGVPHLDSINKKVVFISWRVYPDMAVNRLFVTKITNMFPDRGFTLLFLCRSGQRSLEAVNELVKLNYTNCYNISDGFEGRLSNVQRRSTIDGWKFNDLPWVQF